MIHKFKKNGVTMALDVHSGAVHVIDALVDDLLNLGSLDEEKRFHVPDNKRKQLNTDFGQQAVSEALEEINQLIRLKLLFTEPDPADEMRSLEPGVIKALCLHVAHDCNMSCEYCFASEGTFKGQRSLMKRETAFAALDFLIQHSGNRNHLEVDFFGGEPLLNFELVKETVAYGRKKEQETGKTFRFTLTTNGLGLNEENMAYINEHMSNVVLSIDGRPETNDNMRHCHNGDGTYELILPKIKAMAELRGDKPHFVRGTFTRKNLDFSRDVAHLAEEGFREISVEPVVAPTDSPLALQEEDCRRIKEEYDALADYYLDKRLLGDPFRFFHFMIDLQQGPCMKKRASGCGAGTEYVAVTPEGELYPCHQFVGNPQFLLGHVTTGITEANVKEQFQHATIYDKDDCRDCWAMYYCSGGCHANAWHTNGSIKQPYQIGCQLERARIETALMLMAKESEENCDDQS